MYNSPVFLMAAGLAIISLVACSDSQQASFAKTQSVSFTTDIQPILKNECLECHAKGQKGHRKSGLSMETYAELMAGTRYGPVIEPGSSISSTLVRLIDHKADDSINMPHEKAMIPRDEIVLIKKWVDEGARNN